MTTSKEQTKEEIELAEAVRRFEAAHDIARLVRSHFTDDEVPGLYREATVLLEVATDELRRKSRAHIVARLQVNAMIDTICEGMDL